MGPAVSATLTLILSVLVTVPAFLGMVRGDVAPDAATTRFLVALVVFGVGSAALRAVVDAYARQPARRRTDLVPEADED